MTTRPTIAIGVPVYNGEAFLAECIESLLGQSRPPDEIIIADNCSTDATLEIARSYESEQPVRVVTSDVNRGAAQNFNRLVDLTDSDLFAWAAADDTSSPGLFAAQEAALEDPTVSCAYGDLTYIDAAGDTCGRPDVVGWTDADDAPTRVRELLTRDQFHSHLHVCGPVFGLLRRRDLLETGRIRPFGGSDKALIVELAMRGRLTAVAPVIHRRKHPASSVVANPDAQSRRKWFDPTLEGPATPEWSLLTAMLRSAQRAPLSRRDRAAVVAEILRWSRRNRGWRVIGGEVRHRMWWQASRRRTLRSQG
jgi:glycosyltransferase involved in cell wall biosynthesis